MLENAGDGTFSEVANAAGAGGSSVGRSEAVATADIDKDGFMDLLIANGKGRTREAFNQGPTDVFVNATANENSWLHVDLTGTVSNRSGIGALLFLTTPDGKVQRREAVGGMHQIAQNHSRIHFGLGGNQSYSALEVRWPSGIVQSLAGGNINQVLTVVEPLDLDTDGDTIFDSMDNCQTEFNPSQCDSNNDGYVNHCDADFDGNLISNFADLLVMGAVFFSQLGDTEYDPDVDLNCDNVINFPDLELMKSGFFQPPGPSAFAP